MKNPGKDKAKAAYHADENLDLRGKICPMTFVYTKLALENISRGKILKVKLDFPPAFTNVPRSVKLQKLGKVRTFWIQKGV